MCYGENEPREGDGDWNIYHSKAKREVLVLHHFVGEDTDAQRGEAPCHHQLKPKGNTDT